jgi:molybdopterin-guanine dinucleotide biosynthesis protein B
LEKTKTLPNPEIIAIVGSSGSGKTTLLEKLIPLLTKRGLRVGTIKHDVHGFEIDKPGKDSWRHKRAGAVISAISSPNKIGLVMDTDHDWTIRELAGFFPDVHLILTEGYKRADFPKIEVFRPEVHDTPVCTEDKNLLALVSDEPLNLTVPVFEVAQIKELADFIIAYLHP